MVIEAAGEAKDNKLTQTVVAYLTGEADGVAKDPRLILRLYMALSQYREAARTAVIIAHEEQTNGNYRIARDILLSSVQELRQRHLKVPAKMINNLGLLHSYVLAKFHVKSGNHMMAARLLIRISQNISKFPSHIVPILSSTVIECHKVNLRHTSFTYASILLRAEHREKIDPRYRRRFEAIVRRPERVSPEEVDTLSSATACPFCSRPVPDYELTCGSCLTYLPYCTITGKHIVKEDVTLCPNCDFPMAYTTLLSFLENNPDLACLMCSAPLVRDELHRLVEVTEFLLGWNSGPAEPDPTAETPPSVKNISSQQDRTLEETPFSEDNTSLMH